MPLSGLHQRGKGLVIQSVDHQKKDWKAVSQGHESLIAEDCLLKAVDPVSLESSTSGMEGRRDGVLQN